MKKIMMLLILTLGIISLTSCNGLKEGTTTTRWIPGEYAYDEYFEYDVYALSYFGKDGRHHSIAHAFNYDDFFEGIEGTIEDVIKDSPHDFNGRDYGGICFTAKTGVEVISATYTVVAKKDCYVELGLCGVEIDENDNPIYSELLGGGGDHAISVAKDYYNYESEDPRGLIKLTANEPITVTIDTIQENGEFNKGVKYNDFGRITEACDEDEYRRFLLSFIVAEIGQYGYIEWLNRLEFYERDLGIRIYNVSFDVKKI